MRAGDDQKMIWIHIQPIGDSTTPRTRPGLLCLAVALSIAASTILQSQAAAQTEKTDPYFQSERKKTTRPTFKPDSPNKKPAKPTVSSQFEKAIAVADEESSFEKQISSVASEESGDEIKQVNAESIDLGNEFQPGRILAKVGGHPIFVSDLAIEAHQLINKFIPTAPQEIKEQEIKKVFPRLLPKYIESKLLFVDVKQSLPDTANLDDIFETTEDQFDEHVLPKIMEAAGVKSAAMLDAQFRAQGSSLRKFRRSWSENELIKYILRDKLEINSEVSHRDMYDAYIDNKDDFAVKAKVRWEQLMVRFEKFPNRDAAYKAIAEMGNEVYYGASLSAVAKKQSHGFHAEDGGQQGWTTRGSLRDKKLDKLLFSMDLDELSEIIESDKGFHIVRVLERTDDGYVPFEEAQVQIKQKILEKKRSEALQKHVADLRKRIPVEIYESTQVAGQPSQTQFK